MRELFGIKSGQISSHGRRLSSRVHILYQVTLTPNYEALLQFLGFVVGFQKLRLVVVDRLILQQFHDVDIDCLRRRSIYIFAIRSNLRTQLRSRWIWSLSASSLTQSRSHLSKL